MNSLVFLIVANSFSGFVFLWLVVMIVWVVLRGLFILVDHAKRTREAEGGQDAAMSSRKATRAKKGGEKASRTVATPLPSLPPPPPPQPPQRDISNFKPRRFLVTQPGECQWDVRLAERSTLPKRLDVFGLPTLHTPDDLWRFLGLSSYRELVRLSDGEGLSAAHSKLSNYWYRDIPKRRGGLRRLHAPKPALKAVQRRILREILDRVPVHPAATAFRPGCDAARNAAAHTGREVLLCYDLADFFPSIRRRRVAALFQWLGYHPKVARILSFLCTVRSSSGGHVLPQGAPTSPALANLLCHRLDRRLSGLARRFGAVYTRYADDLAFSGDTTFKRGLARFVPLAETIVRSEGFRLNAKKRRFMRRGDSQRVTGLVVNERVSVPRTEFDRLKAILHNAKKSGNLESQNRESHPDFAAHLRGRLAWLGRFHPERAERLRATLDALTR